MRRFDHFSNTKVVWAARVVANALEKTLFALNAVKLGSAAADDVLGKLKPLWQRAFNATRGISNRELRLADRGARLDLERAEKALDELKRKLLATMPPLSGIVADWADEANAREQFYDGLLAKEPGLYQSTSHVLLLNQASIAVSLFVVYVFLRRRGSE